MTNSVDVTFKQRQLRLRLWLLSHSCWDLLRFYSQTPRLFGSESENLVWESEGLRVWFGFQDSGKQFRAKSVPVAWYFQHTEFDLRKTGCRTCGHKGCSLDTNSRACSVGEPSLDSAAENQRNPGARLAAHKGPENPSNIFKPQYISIYEYIYIYIHIHIHVYKYVDLDKKRKTYDQWLICNLFRGLQLATIWNWRLVRQCHSMLQRLAKYTMVTHQLAAAQRSADNWVPSARRKCLSLLHWFYIFYQTNRPAKVAGGYIAHDQVTQLSTECRVTPNPRSLWSCGRWLLMFVCRNV